MTALKRIVSASYQTTDGQTFSDKNEAAKHQANLDRLTKVEDIVRASLSVTDAGGILHPLTTVNDVARLIVDNADALREILPKRAKAAPQPLNAIGELAAASVGLPQVPVKLESHDDVTPAAAAFSFPAGLVNNVGNQQALANA
jgi:hypothetical protein